MTQTTQINNNIIPPGVNPLQLTVNPLPQSQQSSGTQSASNSNPANQFLSGGDAPSFKDMLDTINPLQHIPIVSKIYQSLTGDVPSSGANIAGGLLYGGPFGMMASIMDTVIQQQTGTDFTGNIMAALQGKQIPAMQTAANDSSPTANMNWHQKNSYNAYVQASLLT